MEGRLRNEKAYASSDGGDEGLWHDTNEPLTKTEQR